MESSTSEKDKIFAWLKENVQKKVSNAKDEDLEKIAVALSGEGYELQDVETHMDFWNDSDVKEIIASAGIPRAALSRIRQALN